MKTLWWVLAVESLEAAVGRNTSRGVIFVKTYKTGSTTVAEFLSTMAYGKGLYCLHPSVGGNFRQGELRARGQKREVYDMSFRHPTPQLDENALATLIPNNPKWITIIREPISRFISTLYFVKRIGMRYGYQPRRVTEAIKKNEISPGEANAFCENFAHVLTGRQSTTTLAYSVDSPQEKANEIIARLNKRNYLVLLQDNLLTSLALMAAELDWSPDAVKGIGVSTARASTPLRTSRRKQPPSSNCPPDSPCANDLLQCNAVDHQLYLHYKNVFADRLAAIPNIRQWIDSIQSTMPGRTISSLPGPWARLYPINCQQHNKEAPAQRQKWRNLHSCQGRPRS